MDTELILSMLICTGASFLGAFTQRVSGFGYGIIVMMIYPLVIKYDESNALSGLISMFAAIQVAYTMRDKINWKQALFPLIPYTVTNFLAVQFVDTADTSLLKRLLGCALIVLSIYFFFFSGKIKIKPTKTSAVIAGALSGAMSGMFAMGGPPMVIYFLSATDSNDEYLATIQCYFSLSNIISATSRAIKGFFTARVGILALPAFAAMLIANFLGKKVYGKLSPVVLKKIVYAFMAVSGVITLING